MMNHWRELLLEAVSPLESGVRQLQISGYRPPGDEPFRPSRTAAVLVPLIDAPEPEMVFTRRAEDLPQHPGQVSFPGGAAEENDNSAVETALREAHEEIGLPRQVTRPIGFLDRMDTISDYRVLPVVALITPRSAGSWISVRLQKSSPYRFQSCSMSTGTKPNQPPGMETITLSTRFFGRATKSGALLRPC
jgi:8-oxo-dGTP pyrophosphatase MutT (NUDIX family)